MPAILAVLAAVGRVIMSFGRFLLPVLGRIWPLLLRLLAWITGSWSRIMAFLVLPLSIGGCEAGYFETVWNHQIGVALEARNWLFGKITEPFPAWIQNLGAFVNSGFPLDTLFTVIGMLIATDGAFIAIGFAGKVLKKFSNADRG